MTIRAQTEASTPTYSLWQRRPAVPSGQVQVLCGLQVAPCRQGGTQGVVTAEDAESNNEGSQSFSSDVSEASSKRRLASFTAASAESVGAAAHVEAHTHAAVLARLLALNRLCRRHITLQINTIIKMN